MRLMSSLFLFAAMASWVGAAPPDTVRLPTAPVLPVPRPDPESPVTLTDDVTYVVDSDVECIVLGSPRSRVKIVPDAGPQTIRAKFIDGAGKIEARKYKGPFLYFIEPAEDGACELIVIPKGAAEAGVIRRTITVRTGTAPQPPPKPVDPVVPVVPVTSFRVIFVYESADNLTAAQKSVIYGKVVSDYLNVKATKEGTQPGWRRYDKDTTGEAEQPTMKVLWQAVKPNLTTIPCYCIEVNGKAEILPLPATVAACLTELKRYAGDK